MPPIATRLLATATLLAALAAGPTAAQITVTRADVVAQLTASQRATDFSLAGAPAALQPLADRTGPGQTWDLSPFAWTAGVTSTASPATPPVPGSGIEGLDAATHVVAYAEGDSASYAFVRVTDDAFDILGVTAEVEDSGETVTAGLLFRPFDRVFPLPLTASSEWETTYALEFVPALDFIETETTDSSAVVGWGTLVTPAGSATVLQVRTKTVSVATFSIPGQPAMTERDSSYTVEFVSRSGAAATLFLDGEGDVVDASYTALGGGSTAGRERPSSAALAVSVASANPTRRGTAVEVAFTLPETADVSVDVFDALGRRVLTRPEGTQAAGARRTLVPTADLPAGIYVVRLAAGADAGAARFTVVE
jgi:hypothetical protein